MENQTNQQVPDGCTHECSSCGESCAFRDPKSLLEKPHALSHIKKTIAVVSGKGGVGKFHGYIRACGYASAQGVIKWESWMRILPGHRFPSPLASRMHWPVNRACSPAFRKAASR